MPVMHVNFPKQPGENVIPTPQMRKVRRRKVPSFAPSHRADKQWRTDTEPRARALTRYNILILQHGSYEALHVKY